MTSGKVHVHVAVSRNSLAPKIVLRRVGILLLRRSRLIEETLAEGERAWKENNEATITAPEMKLENVPVPRW